MLYYIVQISKSRFVKVSFSFKFLNIVLCLELTFITTTKGKQKKTTYGLCYKHGTTLGRDMFSDCFMLSLVLVVLRVNVTTPNGHAITIEMYLHIL